MINYYVTGAFGWIGQAFVSHLLDVEKIDRERIHVFLMPKENSAFFEGLGVNVKRGDLSDVLSIERFLDSSDKKIVIHLAGLIHPKLFSSDFIKVNLNGTRNLIETAKKHSVKQAVIMSSNSPIGASRQSSEIFDELSAYNPYMGYGYSKMLMEQYLQGGDLGLPVTIIRAPWFYGPRQPARQSLFFQMIKDGKFPIFGDGSNKRSMAYVDNLAYGLFLCCDNVRAYNQVFWIADERPYSMREIIDTVQNVMEVDFDIKVKACRSYPELIPNVARYVDSTVQGIGLYNQKIHVLGEMNLTIACSTDKAKSVLGYTPKIQLREGMKNSIGWMLNHGYEFS